uniref:Senescence-associated protein n=1 Tax=Salix viminalis TaxID=40686 RepID=A0A6N2KFT6_SALVM
MFEEKKHLQLIHERSTALNGTNNHQRTHDFLEPIHGAEFCHCRIQLALPSLPSREIAAMIKLAASKPCKHQRVRHAHPSPEIAVFATLKSPLSKPRAHAMTCMNQKRAAEFTGIAFAAETADTAESAAMSVHGLPAPTVFDPAIFASALFDPVTAGLYSRRATARAPLSSRAPGGARGDESERHGADLSGSWQQGTLPLTIPRRVFKSSAKDSTAARWELYFKAAARLFHREAWQRHVPPGQEALLQPDSDLEAFSHNPTHGSFAPLAFQPSAMTNCANQRFLSKSRHRRIKKQRRYERLAATSQLSCGNFLTSSFKFRRSKGSIGHAFTVRIRTGNQNQTSFYPFVPHEISVLVELILGHLRYLLTDVPPQPNSPPDNVFRPDRPPKRPWVQKEGQRPPPIHGISKITLKVVVFHLRRSSHLSYTSQVISQSRTRVKLNRVFFPADSAKPVPLAVVSLDSRQGQWESLGFPLSVPVLSRLFDARGRPRKGRSQSVPGRHATTRSRRGSSSSSPPTADGFGTGTPEPSPQSQSFSRGYGSILPTSLAYIVPSTRGCSPWRPDAVMSTTGRGRHSVLRIFKGRGRTGHHATCGALPAAGPYLRLSRFQEKITLPEAPADVSGLPNVAVSRHVPDRLTHVQVPFTWNLSLFGLQSSHLNICYYHQDLHRRPLRPGSRPGFCSDRRALLLIGAWRLPRRPGIGRALQRHPFSGLVDSAADFDFHDHRPAVSAQLGTVTRLPVHPASPVLLTKNGPLGALDSVARLNEAAAPSYLFKSFAPIPKSDERFARQYRCGPPPEFPLASPRSGIVHHLSGPDRHALTRTFSEDQVSFLAPYGFTRPLTRTHVRLLGPCFKTGRMGSPQADARSAHVPGHAVTARAAVHDRSDGISTGAATAIRIGPRPEPIGGPAVAVPHPTGAHRRPHPLPSRQFQALFDSLFKVLFIFPSRYLFAIGLSPIFSLGRNLPPDWAAFPNNPTRRQRLVVRQGPVTTGLSPSPAPPSRGLGPGPPLRTLLQTTIRTPRAPDSQAGHFPVRSPLLGESLASLKANARGSGRSRGRQARARPCPRVSQPPLVVATAAEDSILGQPRAGARGRPVSAPALVSRGEWGRRCVTPRQTCPRPGGLGRNLRSKTRWFTGFCNSHQVSHFATFFIDARAEISVAESRSDYHKKKARPRHRGYEGGLLVLNFLGASRAGVRWRAVSGADASLHGTRGHEGRVPPEPSLSCHGFAGRSAGAGFDNDPSAGSPTETLLRLLLPLNDKVQWTSRDVASGEPPRRRDPNTSPDHSIGRSDGRCVQRAGT